MPAAKPRLLYANRTQGEIRTESVDHLLPPDHPARAVWAFVETLDLSDLLADVRSVPGHPGAPAIDPRLLLAVWLQATADGYGSSRVVAGLCDDHLAYRWLCGGVPVGYHTLSDFRTGHGETLDRLLTETVAVLLHEGLIDLTRVAQDGLRVRAAAGAGSFRREPTIERCLTEARDQVAALRSQAGEDAGAGGRREQAARRAAAADRVARLQGAREALAALRGVNADQPPSRRKDPAEVRASTTDPEARVMKMPDGGFRPAYNVQFAATTVGGVIVGVAVTTEGTDGGQLTPMLKQVEDRSGVQPHEVLVDGGFATLDAIDRAERTGTTVYAPVKEEQKHLDAGADPYARRAADTAGTAAWRARMGTPAAKAIYKERAQTAEWVNARARHRGLDRVTVRGRAKVWAVVLWQALAHNLERLKALRAASPGIGARRPVVAAG